MINLLRTIWRMGRLLRLILTAPCLTPEQPGEEVFPKRIFELDLEAGPTPGGRTAAYATLSRELREQSWARDVETPSPLEQWRRRVHAAVLLAHELEQRLLAHLEGPS